MEIISHALAAGRTVLTEYESKKVLAAYGLPMVPEVLVEQAADLGPALDFVGLPAVMKGCRADLTHKTEKSLVRVDIRDQAEASRIYQELIAIMDGHGAVLVQALVRGQRELALGLTRDDQFGPAVMFGLGGIYLEVLRDVSFRVAPVTKADALEMMSEIRGKAILGPVRGQDPADLNLLAGMLMALGRLGLEEPAVKEVDVNPVILFQGRGVAVDALITLERQ